VILEVVVKYEWDNFKDIAKLKEYYGLGPEMRPMMEEADKKYKRTRKGYSDGSGHMVAIHTFEDAESYAKFWDDEELQKQFVKFCRTVKNMDVKVLRPSLQVPPK
jgi:hypothetical protein